MRNLIILRTFKGLPLLEGLEPELLKAIGEKAKDLKIMVWDTRLGSTSVIIEFENPRRIPEHKIAMHFKGFISWYLRKRHAYLMEYRSLWAKSYNYEILPG